LRSPDKTLAGLKFNAVEYNAFTKWVESQFQPNNGAISISLRLGLSANSGRESSQFDALNLIVKSGKE